MTPKKPQYAPAQDVDAEHEIRFTVYCTGYGQKPKLVRDIGLTLSRVLLTEFGDRYRMVDHRSRPIEYDPQAHHYGLGDNWEGTLPSANPPDELIVDGVKYSRIP